MSDVRTQLEGLLNQRIIKALASLPEGGKECTPARAKLIERTVAEFLRDVRSVANSAAHRHSAASG